eukprot:Rhum_TRINITY_DN14186_c8_g1::Rhum_TRINITY_DN14186_c8_g1_i1::g.72953::m.72953
MQTGERCGARRASQELLKIALSLLLRRCHVEEVRNAVCAWRRLRRRSRPRGLAAVSLFRVQKYLLDVEVARRAEATGTGGAVRRRRRQRGLGRGGVGGEQMHLQSVVAGRAHAAPGGHRAAQRRPLSVQREVPVEGTLAGRGLGRQQLPQPPVPLVVRAAVAVAVGYRALHRGSVVARGLEVPQHDARDAHAAHAGDDHEGCAAAAAAASCGAGAGRVGNGGGGAGWPREDEDVRLPQRVLVGRRSVQGARVAACRQHEGDVRREGQQHRGEGQGVGGGGGGVQPAGNRVEAHVGGQVLDAAHPQGCRR